jgi:esterase/lipase superfamily enzyme
LPGGAAVIVLVLLFAPFAVSQAATLADGAATELYFLTNRAAGSGATPGQAFGNQLGELQGGVCTVATAADDGRGELRSVRSEAPEQVFRAMESRAAKGLIVYIHGYYEDFERSCRRAAVFKRNLGLEAEFLLFSWPANSTPLTYGADVADLEASTPIFIEVLRALGARVGPQNMSVIGHSLGTRGLVRSLQGPRLSMIPLRHLMLVASDMDRAEFLAVLPELQQRVRHITLLVSDRDLPLRLSRLWNWAPRLGQADTAELDGVEVIDVTDIANRHLSGHVYHLRNEEVLRQLRAALRRD